MAALGGVKLAEGGIEAIEGLLSQLLDPPQWMVGRDPLLYRDVGEQGAAALLLTTHQRQGSCPIIAPLAGFFSELLGISRHH
jgi:hypothetical protein